MNKLLILFLFSIVGCAWVNMGEKDARCYSNGTCNAGLSCLYVEGSIRLNPTCVDPKDVHLVGPKVMEEKALNTSPTKSL